jgi:signal transduction histidine kinase/ligand-binding sensor domain-containing protein/DNA-binding response OmpR family regulator
MRLNYQKIGIVFGLCLLCLFYSLIATSQPVGIKFRHLSTKDGLSCNDVRGVFEDSNGFIWFATSDGLNRWNGYEFDVFKNYNDDLNSLPNNFLLCLAEDSSKNIWIGTNHGGVAKYNTVEERFYRYEMISGDETSIPGMVVRCIYVDTKNTVWIGTHSGLAKYDPIKNNFKRFIFPTDNSGTIPDIRSIIQPNKNELIIQSDLGFFQMDLESEAIQIYKVIAANLSHELFRQNNPVCFDSRGFLWIGSKSGLFKINLKTGAFKSYQPENAKRNTINSNNYSVIFEDSRKNIWIGTENKGVNLYHEETDNFTSFTKESSNNISNNIITNIYEDNGSTIWISTLEGGVSYFSYENRQFEYFTHDPKDINSISSNKIGAFYEDKDGFLWIGTEDGGLNKLLPKEKKFKRYHLKTDYIAPCILSIENESDNSLFITGLRIGLYSFHKASGKFSDLMRDAQPGKNQSVLHINELGFDAEGNVWLTTHAKEGIMVYDPKTKSFYTSTSPGSFNKEILSVPYAVSMKQDSKKRIWILSYLGLYMFDSKVHSLFSNNDDIHSLSSNYLYTFFEDSKNNIWIGSSKGLDRLIEQKGNIIFERYNEKYSLPANVKGILEDNHGNLWLSSNQGITKFNPGTKRIKNFKINRELENQEFSERLCYKTSSGEMYFGGTNGFVRFNPDSLYELSSPPKIYIVDFQLFNKSQKVDGKSPLKQSILYTKEIKLSYKQSVISFEYAALDCGNDEPAEYAYIMEGFDDTWNFVGDKRYATYTNLSPGKYTFHVTTTDGNQLSGSKGASVSIKIKPPAWRTVSAYILYFILVVTMLYIFRRSIINREMLKNELLSEKNAIKAVQEANMMKLRFFTNISHEFRTPLTLIKAPVEKLISSISQLKQDEQKDLLKLVQKNSDKLLRMVNQLLDYRKLEAGNLVLELSGGDIMDFCRKTWSIFNEMAQQKKINYVFRTSIDSQIMTFDEDKIEKIIMNLLSNAFKFTPEGGQITLSLEKISEVTSINPVYKHYILITVKDSGVGIPEKDLDHIFDRFYSVSRNGLGKYEGTGIGLTLVKEFTQLHQGEIFVKSKECEGSEFSIKIPIIEYKAGTQKAEGYETTKEPVEKIDPVSDTIDRIIEGKPKSGKRKILIVEDDNDLRVFLRNELLEEFDVIQARDGEEGLKTAFFNNPDLIISDVMMPNMDGIEFCRSIKSDERTSHLPVILLTARHSYEKQIEGLNSGADDYIFKPFNRVVLKTRINNLLNLRSELQQKFINSTSLNFDHGVTDDSDKKLIQSIIDIVLENITNEKINADFIAKRLHISRSLIYIKVEALTGQSVNEFVRNIRLKKATRILLQKRFSITEVAYSVGFSSQSYFTRCFTSQFGKSPSEFTLENKQ